MAAKLFEKWRMNVFFVMAALLTLVYCTMMSYGLSEYYLYVGMFFLGAVNYGATNTLNIYIHSRFTGHELLIHSKQFYIIPYISASAALLLFGGISTLGLNVMLAVLMGCSIILFYVENNFFRAGKIKEAS